MNYSIKKLQITFAADYNQQMIDNISDLAVSGNNQNDKQRTIHLEQINSDKSLSRTQIRELSEYISDDHYIESKSLELVKKLQIVGFYLTIEKSIKDIMKLSDLFDEDEINYSFRINDLKKSFKNKACDLKQLNGFIEFDELRCINNCIKHGGYVGSELAVYGNWIENQKLEKLDEAYYRLKDDVQIFINNIKDEIIKKIS